MNNDDSGTARAKPIRLAKSTRQQKPVQSAGANPSEFFNHMAEAADARIRSILIGVFSALDDLFDAAPTAVEREGLISMVLLSKLERGGMERLIDHLEQHRDWYTKGSADAQ